VPRLQIDARAVPKVKFCKSFLFHATGPTNPLEDVAFERDVPTRDLFVSFASKLLSINDMHRAAREGPGRQHRPALILVTFCPNGDLTKIEAKEAVDRHENHEAPGEGA